MSESGGTMNRHFERILLSIANGAASRAQELAAWEYATAVDHDYISAGLSPVYGPALSNAFTQKPDDIELMAAISEFC
jgi:hypothetical protein